MYPVFLALSKLQPCLLKQPLQTQKKLKEVEIMQQNAIYICISCSRKIGWFPVKNTDVSRTQEARHVIHIFLASSLGKV